MRKAVIIAAFAVSVCLLGGCDFFRVLAGRPTAREIEAKRKTILALDTLAQQPADDAVLHEQESLQTPPQTEAQTQPEPVVTAPKTPAVTPPQGNITTYTRSLALFADPRPEYRYYVMIGTFGSRDNAVRQASRAEKAGYQAVLLPFRSGTTAVGVCPTNDRAAADASFEKLRSEAFFPKDAWILIIE